MPASRISRATRSLHTVHIRKSVKRKLPQARGHSTSRLAQDTPLPPYQITAPWFAPINARLLVLPFAIATAFADSSHSPTWLAPGSEHTNCPLEPYSVTPPKVPIAIILSVPRSPAGSSRHSPWVSFVRFSVGALAGGVRAGKVLAAVGWAGSTAAGVVELSNGFSSGGAGEEHADALIHAAVMTTLAKIRVIVRPSSAQVWLCAE